MYNIWKTFSIDDKGVLNIYENRIQFKGNKNTMRIKNIRNVYITKQIPSYGTHSISGFISIICIWYTFLIVFSSIEYFLTFFIIIIVFYPVSLFLTRSDWVGIEYKDHGRTKKAFFTDGSIPGGSILAGEKSSKYSDSLFKKISSIEIVENQLSKAQ